LAVKALGSKTAPIVMEVFSDFQCPACRELYQQTLRPLIENYVSANKVYLVHRDMPLPVHKYARDAARYANAAARLGRFEKVVETLYGKQQQWSVDGNIEGALAGVLTPAEMKQVRQMVRDGKLDAAIDQDVSLGSRFQVRQTPTTIIIHRGQTYPIVGLVSYPILRRFLDDLLGQ
jgi:protein-disulfide isomerase